MFEYTLLHWTTFFSAAFLLNIAPGPDIAFILGQTAHGGRQAGFSAMFGIWTGALLHVAMAALGLSAILTTSAFLFSVVKWVGAAYLIWLGVQALWSDGHGFAPKESSDDGDSELAKSVFRQGTLVAALNPKTAIFFLAFLPQFVVVGAGPSWAQLLLHGSLIIVVAALVETPLVLIGATLTDKLKNNASIGKWLDRGLGVLLIGLGIRLLVTRE